MKQTRILLLKMEGVTMRVLVFAAVLGVAASSPFPIASCPAGWRQAVKQSVWSTQTISVGTFPNYAVTCECIF